MIDVGGLDALIAEVARRGYTAIGPVVRDGAVTVGPVADSSDLPCGWGDRQGPGRYRLESGRGDALFDWAVGPASWKPEFFPPHETIWRATVDGGGVTVQDLDRCAAPVAIIGARPCDLAALGILDRVLAGGATPDPGYVQRRAAAVVIAVECGAPSASCFCTSMGTGPGATGGFDLALTELGTGDGHRFLVRTGSDAGVQLIDAVPHRPVAAGDDDERQRVLARASDRISRTLDTQGLPALLGRNLEHPRWADVADRCLSCGNCTLVCPTCFCSDVDDVSSLTGDVERHRSWASCFDLVHSYIHGGPVRPTTSSRYRQWLTHKLSTWWDQFDSSGCVGCGRCITWCPVGIDLTEEAAAVRATDGAVVGGHRD